MDSTFEVAFLGTTGSCAYNGGCRAKYGTNTPCVAVRAGGATLLFDAGSGICGFHQLPGYQCDHASLFFSHYHTDHFSGLLFFSELFDPQKKFSLYGSGRNGHDLQDIVNRFLSEPLHPVGLRDFNAEIAFRTIQAGEAIQTPEGVTVRTHSLSHPGGALGYRVEYNGKAFVYCTDVELSAHADDAGLLDFMHGADLLVLDSFFDEGKVLPGWGHSSWRQCAEWAKRAQAKKLALFHFEFSLCDSDIDAIEQKAREIFPSSFAAADGMRVSLG